MAAVLYTDRLLLRELQPDDEAGLFALDSDPEVHRYLGGRPVRGTEEIRDAIAFIRNQYADHGIGRWAVMERTSGAFLGWAGLKWITEPVNGRVHYYDLGYRILREHWGKGFATEAACAWVAYAFNELQAPAVYAIADCANSGSHGVLTKVGLRCTETFVYDGTPHHWYELGRITWMARSLQ
ncbi:GNAT family N-acetyltransferase [Flaviaesturariibacter amylovorans]|uniref:GNAT family N-acetyltransferase n=1 Tax=Flaviaesturariibacter amylovorans TaxID=1084520 RepID=A0ABP8HPI9_9BACT